ncbi:MAG TPA: class I SAM-dependent methyltransferase [Mycobacteriales bacterium]|jgi:SAM-dependent methyltransferase|nr:class I SAM-dependent methyltransferase [Mycobacteriales bacterium]
MTVRGRLFAQVADLYDDVRPDYPDGLYDALESAAGPVAGQRVLDLAAGTGLATRALTARGARVVAMDISPGMLAALRRRTPSVPVVVAKGEALPFGSQVFDLVVCATAWHWVETEPAVAEIRRALRPGGHLALWWANHLWDEGVDWEKAQGAVYERWAQLHGSRPADHTGVGPRQAADDLRERGLDVVVGTELTWQREVSREEHIDVLRTHSDNLALGDRREEFLAQVADALEPWPRVTERLWGPLVVARVS